MPIRRKIAAGMRAMRLSHQYALKSACHGPQFIYSLNSVPMQSMVEMIAKKKKVEACDDRVNLISFSGSVTDLLGEVRMRLTTPAPSRGSTGCFSFAIL